MSDDKPRVTAHVDIDGITERMQCSAYAYTAPDVHLSISFDLHDHKRALGVLEHAVDRVKAQITEVKP